MGCYKRLHDRMRDFFCKYINGTRGAVSLLLALVISPLLSVSLILVESARYQNAVQLMQEIIDSASFSTLAEYDSFLDDRFGLLSVSQEIDINDDFNGYLETNASAIGSSVSIDSSSATGDYSLSDIDILRQQVLEYSEISVASEFMMQGFDIDSLLDELSKILELEDIEKEIEAANAAVDVATEVEKIIEAIIKVRDHYDNSYVSALSEYQDAYTTFEDRCIDLIDALYTAEENLEEDETEEDIYDKRAVRNAISRMKTARTKYKNKTTTLKTSLSTLKSHIDTIFSSMNALTEKLNEYEDKTSDGSAIDVCTTSSYEWILIIVGTITDSLDATIGDDYSNKMTADIHALQEQAVRLNRLQSDTITSSWSQSDINDEYGYLILTSVDSDLGYRTSELIDELNNNSHATEDEELQMSNLLDLAGDLLGVDGLYDINLDAAINTAGFYEDTSMSISSRLVMSSITDLLGACDEFVEGITSFDVIKAVKALGRLLKAIAEFLSAILAWTLESLAGLMQFTLSGPKEWYNSLLLYGYAAYNLPNRTNYDTGKTLTGYSYNNIFTAAGGIQRADRITGSIREISSLTDTAGTDKMFKGAQAEYVLVGSANELMNQSIAFFDLYLFRLVLDLWPILNNSEVSAMASIAGPGSWIVKLAIALSEPMLDTIILVNSNTSYQYVKKDTLYLTPSGIALLLIDLNSITGVSENLKDKIKDTIVARNGEPTKKGMFKCTYTEHMLLLMLLSLNQQTYLKRLRNIIQLEAGAHYEAEYDFNLGEAYTYIKADVAYTLKPMIDIDSLTDRGLFAVTSHRYSGY